MATGITDNKNYTLIGLRLERKLSQSEVAEALGLKQPMIAMLENGKANPSIETAKKLSNFYGVSIEKIFN